MTMALHRSGERQFQRNHSLPEGSWFRQNTEASTSPRSDESDHDFDSDEDNNAMIIDYPMESPETSISANDKTFVLKQPQLSLDYLKHNANVNNTTLSSKTPASSRSMQIGRPKSFGLKDIDLTKNRRAAEIKAARENNRNHIFTPIRQNSCPSMTSGQHFNLNNAMIDYSEEMHEQETPNSSMSFNKHRPEGKNCDYGSLASTQGQRPKYFQDPRPNVTLAIKAIKPITLYSQTLPEESSGGNELKDEDKRDVKDVIVIADDETESNVEHKDQPKQNAISLPGIAKNSILLKRRVKKYKRSSADFSEDEDQLQTVPKNPKQQTPQQVVCHKKSNRLLCVFMTVAFAIALGSVYLHLNPHGLCLDGEFTANLTGLEASFKREFYGQHLATRVLLSSIKGHLKTKGSKPLVLSLHGWTGTGKNFATELIAQHLFKHGIHSNFIYKFIIPLHFPHQSLAALYRSQLQQWITSNVTRCSKGGLFVFDEMDKIPQGIVDVLKPFLDARGNHFCKMIFVFLSNTGAKLINQHALEHYKLGDEREKIGLVTLEELFHQISESDPNIWYNDLLRSEVIDHFVPFLPLERKHVKQCIQRDLRDKGNPAVEGLVDHIADEMTYFPEREKLFSISGCKKVSSKVDVAVG